MVYFLGIIHIDRELTMIPRTVLCGTITGIESFNNK